MRRYRIYALLATLVVHALLVGVLFFLRVGGASKSQSMEKEITLVPVGMYGTGAARGGGTMRQEPAPNPPQPKRIEASAATGKTAKSEEALVADNNNPTLEEVKRQKELEAKRREEERQRKLKQQQQAIDEQMAGAFGQGQGEQVKNNAGEGTGGSSSVGAGFSLAGRSIEGNGGVPTRPEGFRPTRGSVVVRIVVNSEGRVVEATVKLKGTSVTDQRTIAAALKAAKKTQFNKAPGSLNQEGTITYHFDIV